MFPWNFLTKFPEGMGKVQLWVRGELIQFHRVEFKILKGFVQFLVCDHHFIIFVIFHPTQQFNVFFFLILNIRDAIY